MFQWSIYSFKFVFTWIIMFVLNCCDVSDDCCHQHGPAHTSVFNFSNGKSNFLHVKRVRVRESGRYFHRTHPKQQNSTTYFTSCWAKTCCNWLLKSQLLNSHETKIKTWAERRVNFTGAFPSWQETRCIFKTAVCRKLFLSPFWQWEELYKHKRNLQAMAFFTNQYLSFEKLFEGFDTFKMWVGPSVPLTVKI